MEVVWTLTIKIDGKEMKADGRTQQECVDAIQKVFDSKIERKAQEIDDLTNLRNTVIKTAVRTLPVSED